MLDCFEMFGCDEDVKVGHNFRVGWKVGLCVSKSINIEDCSCLCYMDTNLNEFDEDLPNFTIESHETGLGCSESYLKEYNFGGANK